MLQSAIVTLREGIEAALVVGLVLVYLRQVGRKELNRAVYLGLLFAILASIAVAFALKTFIERNEEVYEGAVYLLAALFVGSMLIWMHHQAKSIKRQIQKKVGALTASPDASGRAFWGLLLFVFMMVFREGVETVSFLSAVSLNTEAILTFLGGLVGLTLAVLFGVSFVRGSVRLDLRKFFKVTSIVLAVLVVQLIINGLHEWSEAGILPASKTEMAIVGPIVRHNGLFLLAILALPLLVLVGKGSAGQEIPPEESSAARRKALALALRAKRWRTAAGLCGFAILVLLTGDYVFSSRPKELSPPRILGITDGKVVIKTADVDDGNLHRFGVFLEGRLVRFLVIKAIRHKIATAFDACEICGEYGYVQEGKNVICRNCDAVIYIPTIGQRGGCNPIPLKSQRRGGKIIIAVDDLRPLAEIFSKAEVPQVSCPVCQMKLKLKDATKTLDYGGKTYYFCSMAKCLPRFKANPEQFAK